MPKIKPHLFQGWYNLQQDFSNCLYVGTDAQDASCYTHQWQGRAQPRRKGGGGASKATQEEGNIISDQKVHTNTQ